ncbi:hypothetical protein GCM10020331_089300 [Ectobacillus funiculus]
MKIVFKQATIYPITSAKLQGDVLIENNKIKAVAPFIEQTGDMEVIDARGLHLLPGFIDVHTHLGLYDEGTGWAGNDANETVEALTPHIRSMDGIYPLDIAFSRCSSKRRHDGSCSAWQSKYYRRNNVCY